MEKDIGKINKNEQSDIIVRIDDFGGQRGLTIREFVTSERYTGFTKAGVRISSTDFPKFKEMINSISDDDMKESEAEEKEQKTLDNEKESTEKSEPKEKEDLPDY